MILFLLQLLIAFFGGALISYFVGSSSSLSIILCIIWGAIIVLFGSLLYAQ